MSELKAKILAAEDRPFIDVDVSAEWPGVGSVRIITMASADRDEWEAAAMIARARETGTNRLRNLRAELVVRCAVDPATGKRIFGAEDVEALGQKSAKVLDRLFSAATALNAVTEADMKALEKNSVRGRTGASSSVLRWLQAASMWIGLPRSSPPGRSMNGAPSSESKVSH